MGSSIKVSAAPDVQYVLRLADTCLILGQRLSEWCGHAPILEEDIALTNIALDLIGQTRALLTHAGRLGAHESGAPALDEDQLAFLREERDYRNPTIVELPRGDFAFTMLRLSLIGSWLYLLWERLVHSRDTELAGIAGKAVKEARYHQQHAADWVVRLGQGTQESHRRLRSALHELWPYIAELFEDDAIGEVAAAASVGPLWSELRSPWLARMTSLLAESGLTAPSDGTFRSTGKVGRHSEHMGYLLADLQFLQRSYPMGVW